MAIGIFKVIFCWLMILYRQYSPMSVFFVSASYWFHSIPGGNTYKRLRWCSFWQQLLLILYSIGQLYCRHSLFYEFLVFCISLLLSSSHSKWFHLVPGGSNSSRMIPASSSSLQVVPVCSNLFLILECTYSDSDIIHFIWFSHSIFIILWFSDFLE